MHYILVRAWKDVERVWSKAEFISPRSGSGFRGWFRKRDSQAQLFKWVACSLGFVKGPLKEGQADTCILDVFMGHVLWNATVSEWVITQHSCTYSEKEINQETLFDTLLNA